MHLSCVAFHATRKEPRTYTRHKLVTEVGFSSTMASHIMPERFSGGDFTAWLCHFDRCSAANAWNEETRLAKLPAFLNSPAAAYFDSLTEEEKDTLPTLLASLRRCFVPIADREKFYREFDQLALRPSEDPSLFLWRLKELLRNAEPDLSDDAFDALLRRQFMKGLPFQIRMKLLESDPTPDLPKMVSFAQRFRALEELPAGPSASCAAVQNDAIMDPTVPQPSSIALSDQLPRQLYEQQQQRLDKLESLIPTMADQQTNLLAAISSNPTSLSQPNHITRPKLNGVRCFIVTQMVILCGTAPDVAMQSPVPHVEVGVTHPKTVLVCTLRTVVIMIKIVSFKIL